MQSVTDQLGTMRQALNDLTAAMSRLGTQVNDLTSAVKAVQAAKADDSAAKAQPAVSATDLLANAEGDRLGGKLDLALQEYGDYVSKFGDSPQAADAQYYIGSIPLFERRVGRCREGVQRRAAILSRQQEGSGEPILQGRFAGETRPVAGGQRYPQRSPQAIPGQSTGQARTHGKAAALTPAIPIAIRRGPSGISQDGCHQPACVIVCF
ncbi:MAG: hypothetical protein WDO73_11515 [Ignavibacteriota bacterium]